MARSGGFFGSFSANKPSDEEVRRQSGQNSSSAEKVIDVMFKIIFSFTLVSYIQEHYSWLLTFRL